MTWLSCSTLKEWEAGIDGSSSRTVRGPLLHQWTSMVIEYLTSHEVAESNPFLPKEMGIVWGAASVSHHWSPLVN